jgi:hypothetical protein
MTGSTGIGRWFQRTGRATDPLPLDPAEAGAEFGLELRFVSDTSPGRLSTGLPCVWSSPSPRGASVPAETPGG